MLLLIWGGVAGILGYLLTAGKNELIVRLHYRGWLIFVLVFAVAFLGLSFINGVRLRKKLKARRPKPKPEPEEKPKSLETPEDVYYYMVAVNNDGGQEGVWRIVEQLDLMNKLQRDLDELAARNRQEDSLKEAKKLLQDIEDAICLNVRKAINYRIAGGEKVFLDKLAGAKKDNDKLLRGAQDVLLDLAEFINNGKGDTKTISRKIDTYRRTINEILEEENDEEESQEGTRGFDDFVSAPRTFRMQ